ncbi:AAA family ATPase [Nocardiopsis sp. FR4]|uniref:AAA family ATPase n=1 Tax=Nocardiopsis sp. FR4 TaxID=2605985 RepID=UPI00135A44C0|nr:AAA family ATPase [Nocardiopsis sp. FR4]
MTTTQFTFVPATKEQTKVRAAFTGPPGSGKTYTALKVAAHLGEPIGVIDTENGSAAEYSTEFDFQHLVMRHYAPQDLLHAIAAANQAQIGVLIIDTWSKFWNGVGGVLEQVDHLSKGGNKFATGWRDIRPVEAAMIEAITSFPGHVIVTMRSKVAYEVQTNSSGKAVPVKIGLKPEQRDGVEYEFSLIGDLDRDHTMTITKARAHALDSQVIPRPGEELAQELLAWVNDGVPSPTANSLRDQALTADVTVEALRGLLAEGRRRGLLGAPVIDPATEQPTTLGDLITRRGKEAASRAA